MEEVATTDEPKVMKHVVTVNRSVMVFTIIMSLLMGGIGGAGAVYLLSGNLPGQTTSGLTLPVRQKVTLEESSQFIDVAKAVSPSVVSISTSSSIPSFFGQVIQQQGGGTGFIISADGLIATNSHVLQNANTKYTVILADGSNYNATVVDTDPIYDFAILRINAKNLTPVDFGNSDDLQIGQWVMAIGNALAEFQNSVTVGVVSAKDRSITASDPSGVQSENLEGLIQTDAAINPGNSGGPLLNLSGKVVGVNTAVSSSAQGIGFAIPINVLKPAVDSVIKTGHIVRPSLGVRYLSVTKQIATDQKLAVDHGALITSDNGTPAVVSGSAADQAGLKSGDIITNVGGTEVDQGHNLAGLIQQYHVGDKVKITYYRDGKQQITDLTLQEFKR